MVYAFLLGIMVTLTPSLVAVGWLVWQADAPRVGKDKKKWVSGPARKKVGGC
jgi:hypothetical protein